MNDLQKELNLWNKMYLRTTVTKSTQRISIAHTESAQISMVKCEPVSSAFYCFASFRKSALCIC